MRRPGRCSNRAPQSPIRRAPWRRRARLCSPRCPVRSRSRKRRSTLKPASSPASRAARWTSSPRTSTSPARWPARSARRCSSACWRPRCTSRPRRAAGDRRAFRSSRGYWRRWLEWSCAMSDRETKIARLLLTQEIAEFLYREAELLDGRRYDDWLTLLAEDIRYWMPMRRNVKFGEEAREFTRVGQDIAWFDEGKDTLTRRGRQIQTAIHWAGD